ncbi:hypothetical protein FSP39_008374 [Pinctada imbricata]|uniref:Uncharacterized protein n=1 Tax=Pinctada imbricata TaxID=66713 RepID=A0AA89BV74_PINIB|nr:hypothetical protein FSP39_008374 [Pinctada imbricata]
MNDFLNNSMIDLDMKVSIMKTKKFDRLTGQEFKLRAPDHHLLTNDTVLDFEMSRFLQKDLPVTMPRNPLRFSFYRVNCYKLSSIMVPAAIIIYRIGTTGRFEQNFLACKLQTIHYFRERTDLGPNGPRSVWDLETDAYGDVEIQAEGGMERNVAKYIRLSTASNLHVVANLLTLHWGIHPPRLLISVTGEGYGISTDLQKRRKITSALQTIAREKGIWFVTDGADSEISGVIGHVVENENVNTRPTIIGIVTWKFLKGREALLRTNEAAKTAEYKTWEAQDLKKSGDYCLNPFCTHFLLTNKNTAPGNTQSVSTAQFRFNLEEHIRKTRNQQQGGTSDVPGMLIVAGGDNLQSSSMIKRSLDSNRPILILKGSGGFADSLSKIAVLGDISPERIMDMVETYNDTEKGMESMISRRIADLMKHRNWSNAKFVDLDDPDCELDLEMLDALVSNCRDNKLKLQLTFLFNSVDKAKQHVFCKRQNIEDIGQDFLYKILTMAIKDGNTEFVRLLLKECVSLKHYLDQHHEDLYTYEEMEDEREVTKKIRDWCYNEKNRNDPVKNMKNFVVGELDLDIFSQPTNHNHTRPDDPYFGLLIWAVLHHHQSLAKFAWQYSMEPIPTALIASGILRRMRKKFVDINRLIAKQLLQSEIEFSDLARDVLHQCFEENPNDTEKMLAMTRSRWRWNSCLDLAYLLKNKPFISSEACKRPLKSSWMKEISEDNNALRYFLSPVFLGPFILKYSEEHNIDVDSRKRTKEETSYLVFLAMFAYNLLTGFGREPTTVEYILYAWVFSIATEELAEVIRVRKRSYFNLGPEYKSLRQWSLTLYFEDKWNYFDLTTILFFAVGVAFHYSGVYELVEIARALLTISFLAFCMRILKAFSALEELGPKILMIAAMAKDMLYFLIIMVVFIVAYAVANYSLLYPQSTFNFDLVLNVLRLGYWNMYAELLLEEVEIKTPSCTFDPLLYSNGTLPRCPVEHHRQMALVMMGIYLLFSNILLLNILIAMFADTYRRILDRKDSNWNYENYALIREFKSAPIIPIPILVYFVSLIQLIYNKVRRGKSVDAISRNSEKRRQIYNFEREMTYLLTKKTGDEEKKVTKGTLTEETISKLVAAALDKRMKRFVNYFVDV